MSIQLFDDVRLNIGMKGRSLIMELIQPSMLEDDEQIYTGSDYKYMFINTLHPTDDDYVYRITQESKYKGLKEYKDKPSLKYNNMDTYPTINSEINYTSKGKYKAVESKMNYTLTARIRYKVVNTKMPLFTTFILDQQDKIIVSADTDEAFISNLREEMESYRRPISLSRSQVKDMMKLFYTRTTLPIESLKRYGMNSLPTESLLSEHFSEFKDTISKLKSDPFSIDWIYMVLTVPLLNIEEYRPILVDAELALLPMLFNRGLKVYRNKREADVLYDILVSKLDITPKVDKDGREYLPMTYKDLYLLGDTFSIGQAYELSTRTVWNV